MASYKEIVFSEPDPGKRDILIAQLSELGYDGFEEEGDLLKAYISEAFYDGDELSRLAGEYQVNTLQERNWNAEWESSFSPVVVDGRVAIRAHFHEPLPGVVHEIVITPKMSFGTGHHATTWLMIRAMLGLDLNGKDVLDLGTGTGVLALLAEKLGAGSVWAVDNDPWSVDNARENLGLNQSQGIIRVHKADRIPTDQRFDVILANINKHILLALSGDMGQALRPGGYLLLSGILPEDLGDIQAAYGRYLGVYGVAEEKDGWICVVFHLGIK